MMSAICNTIVIIYECYLLVIEELNEMYLLAVVPDHFLHTRVGLKGIYHTQMERR